MKRLATLLIAVLALPAAWSAGTGQQFSVRVTVSAAKCTSETLRETRAAVVQVVCDSSPFVSIEPTRPGAFAGFVGGPFRFRLGSPEAELAGFIPVATDYGSTAYPAEGTVTGFRMVGESIADNHFELLISF